MIPIPHVTGLSPGISAKHTKKVQLAIELHLFFVLSVQAFLAVLDYQALVVFVDYLAGKIIKE